MAGLNRAMLIGRLGKDPETKDINGVTRTTFSMATSESWKDKAGEKHEETQWHNIVVWRGLADVCAKYLRKGSQVYIEGKIVNRSWDDKESGAKRYITEIVASGMQMLDAKGSGGGAGGGAGDGGPQAPPMATGSGASPEDDDLPF